MSARDWDTRPAGVQPTMAELVDQVNYLSTRELAVSDLPVAGLQIKLEQDWQPEAGVLLQPGSITPDMLGETRGQGTAVGTGAVFVDLVITDGLAASAKAGIAGLHVGGTYGLDNIYFILLSTTASTTTFRGHTKAGGVIAAAATVLVDYRIWRL